MHRTFLALACLAAGDVARAHELFAISYSTGEYFALRSFDAALTPLSSIGPSHVAGMEFAPDGTLWALRDGHVPTIVRLDAASGAALATITVGLALVHEGGLAFSPQGIAFAASEANGGVPQLFRLDTSNGLATIVGSLGAGRDISGLAFRDDGRLLALDSTSQSLLVLDASSAAVLSTAPVVTTLGSVCGMTARGSLGYFTTASQSASVPGSSVLVRFDTYSLVQTVVGALPTLSGEGLSGLAWRVDSATSAYCTAGTSSSGCNASLSASGAASTSLPSGFTLLASNVEGQRSALFFYGMLGRAALPWSSGSTAVLCARPPLQRTPAQSSAGSPFACDGALALDWNAFRAAHPSALGAPFVAGSVFDAQAWYRDPPSPKTTSLSNALEFVLEP